jgi:hypothetical protein
LPEFLKELYNSLPPEGQSIFGAVIITFGVFVMIRAWMDGKKKPSDVSLVDHRVIPSWIMMGPLHDMMQSVHGMAEECRTQSELSRGNQAVLRDIARELYDLNRGQAQNIRVLENILRNQELGIHPGLLPPQAPPQRRR